MTKKVNSSLFSASFREQLRDCVVTRKVLTPMSKTIMVAFYSSPIENEVIYELVFA